MSLNNDQLTFLLTEAIRASKKAGDYIRANNPTNIQTKGDDKNAPRGGVTLASSVVTEVDKACQDIILDDLEKATKEFDLGVLSEELVDDNSRFDKDYFWCIDPLDGTLAFIECDFGYCVSICLISKQGESVLGVVYDPVHDVLYHNIKGEKACKNSNVWNLREAKSSVLSLVIDRSFLDHDLFKGDRVELAELAQGLGYDSYQVIQYGGAVLNAMHAAELGDACYFKFPKEERGGGSIWDFGATTCIYNGLELFVTDIYGDTIALNDEETFMNQKGVLFAATKEISNDVQKLYRLIR